MATRLRDLLNVKSAESLEGEAGPVDGSQIIFQNTCHDNHDNSTSYHNNCCVAFITPANVTCATIEVWGGGGGGGGNNQCNEDECWFGFPGSAGAYVVRCLNELTEGDRFDMIIARATNCTTSVRGCHGCWSCVCGPNAQLCAQGGEGGCDRSNWGCGWLCETSCATPYGGDINMPGRGSKYYAMCHYTDGWPFNQVYFSFPGGLINMCGGWMQVQQGVCTDCRICNYELKCSAGEKLLGLGGPNARCFGYIPGLGAASNTAFCECECERPCMCGHPGNPGMVRVTYK